MPIKIFIECSKVDDKESVEDLEKQYNNWEDDKMKNAYIYGTKIENIELKLSVVEGLDVPNKYLIVRYSYGNKISE